MQTVKRYDPEKPQFDVLTQINHHAAGIDIGADEIYVAIPAGRDEQNVRSFGTFTIDLLALARWLQTCGVETVAMEATGVYWVPLYEVLERCGFRVNLINARHIKNVSGRKSDILDCQWIQQLHTYGLLQASFRPPEEICELRSLVRHRDMLLKYRGSHIQHMQKALDLMNLKLTNVISDITGVTGLEIIRSIIAGEHRPSILAQFRDGRCKKSEAEIAKSLEGNYHSEHLFILQQAVELYDFYNQQIQACDLQLEARYSQFILTEQPGTLGPESHKTKRSKNSPAFDLSQALYRMTGVDLTQVDGLEALSVQTILTEIGTDMSKWPTVKHFTSWLGVAPNNKITGGEVKSRSTKKTKNRANTAFRRAAQSLARSQSASGAFFRRIRAKHGAPVAITATAHRLARIVYFMLLRQEPYRDLGADYYDKQHQARTIRNLERRAAQLGLRLEPIPSGERVS
jgi:transposase